MTVERIKDLITQYDELIQYQKQLLDYTFAEEFLSVISTCTENPEMLEAKLHEKTSECQRLRIFLTTAHDKITKLYTQCLENNHVKEFLDFAIFLSTFRNFNEKSCAASLENKNSLQFYDVSLNDFFSQELSASCVKQELLDGQPQFNEFTTYRSNSLNKFSIISNQDIATLNSKLKKVYELFDAEISRRKQVESERNNLERLSKELCCLLLKYQKRSCFLDETRDLDPLISDDHLTIIEGNSNEIYSAIEYDLFSDETLILPPMDFRDDISVKNIDSNELFGKIERELAVSDEISNLSIWHEIQNHAYVSALPFPEIQPTEEYLQDDVSDINIDHDPYSNQEFQNSPLLGHNYESTAMECEKTDELFAVLESAKNGSPKFLEPNEEKNSNRSIGKSIFPINDLPSSTIVPQETRFDCEFCGKSFLRKNSLSLHRRVHLKTSPSYRCEKCGKSYPAENGGEKLIKCPVCDADEHNVSREVSNTWCDICGQDYSNKYNLIHHIHHVHNGKKLHECAVCGKQFAYEGRLKTHALGHGSQNSFNPSICSKAFKFPSDKTKHKRICKKEARLQCAHCDKRFISKASLMSHLSARHFLGLQRSFKCTICDKAFILKSSLKKHQLVHCSDKPIKCSMCTQGFKRMDQKNYHEWRAHGKGDRFNCRYCKNEYRLKENLLRHLQNDH